MSLSANPVLQNAKKDAAGSVLPIVAVLILTGINYGFQVDIGLISGSFLFTLSTLVFIYMFLPRDELKEIENNLNEFENENLQSFITKFNESNEKFDHTIDLESKLDLELSKQIVSRRISDPDKVKKEENEAIRVWVVSTDLKFDSKIENIKATQERIKSIGDKEKQERINDGDKKYIWIVPDSISDTTLNDFQEDLNFDLTKEDRKLYEIIKVPSKNWMISNDITIYNYPNPSKPDKKNTRVLESSFGSGSFIELDYDLPHTKSLLDSICHIVESNDMKKNTKENG